MLFFMSSMSKTSIASKPRSRHSVLKSCYKGGATPHNRTYIERGSREKAGMKHSGKPPPDTHHRDRSSQVFWEYPTHYVAQDRNRYAAFRRQCENTITYTHFCDNRRNGARSVVRSGVTLKHGPHREMARHYTTTLTRLVQSMSQPVIC
jgi:hypothetical protein